MTSDLPKIRRRCRLIRAAGSVFLLFVLASYLATWIWPDLALWNQPWARIARIGGLPPNAASALAPGDRFLLGALAVPYLVSLVWAFHHLDRMLRGFEQGAFFGHATVGHLRAFAGYLLLAKVLALFAVHARVFMMAHVYGTERMHVAVSVSSDELALLLMCALFFLIARMMEEGRRLDEENRSFL